MITLTDAAERALDTARREGKDLRFTLHEHCHTGRFRLAVRYYVDEAGGGSRREVNLGLVWSEDRVALEELRDRLAPPSAEA